MDETRSVFLSSLEQKGFPKIAAIWRPFLERGCTIYMLSDQGYGPRDGYALFWTGRYLPPLKDDRVKMVPVSVYGGLKQVSTDNLIVLGRLRAFKSEELVSEVLGKRDTIHNQAHFRFIDGQRLLQVDTGEMFVRVQEPPPNEPPNWVRDYGVLRLWYQPEANRSIIHFSGLGPVGTLGTSLAITDFSREAMAEVEERLPSPEVMQQSLVEILVKAEWDPKDDPFVVSPSDVMIELVKDFKSAAEPNWPLIHFQRIPDIQDWRYEVWVSDGESDNQKQLSSTPTVCAVLAAIARHSEKEPALDVSKGGYISYEQITESEIAEQMQQGARLDTATVRATIARLRKTLKNPEWMRAFPNLLLVSTSKAAGKGRSITVLRLRAKFKWWDTEDS